MEELSYENIAAVLDQARRTGPKYELSGASTHQYRLNPPVSAAVVHGAEAQYGFQLPEDYVHFITRIANGGAGPGYGILPFGDSLMSGAHRDFQEAYRHSLKKPFAPRRMMPEEVGNYAFSETAYGQEPEKFFIYEKEEDAVCGTDGFLVLGTHGCQWDFGLIVSGGRRGQVFETDNEGGYAFASRSFYEFYQAWLDWLSDAGNIQRELEAWRKLLSGRT